MKKPSVSVVKTLFALSCNVCAYPGCEERLTDPSWRQVRADMAHIRGERPGSARYDATMSDDDRIAFENLMLLCPNHHRLVDRLDPDGHPRERLEEIKARLELACSEATWADDETLQTYALIALEIEIEVERAQEPKPRPRLVVRKEGNNGIEVENVGDADATAISIEPIDGATGNALVLASIPPNRVSAGSRWRAGSHAPTFGNSGPHVVRVSWEDESGTRYDGEFPL